MSPLVFLARHGKLILIAGLVAGIALPGVAATLRPWIPEMVALLLFLTAFRIGPSDTIETLDAVARTTRAVLILQLVLPLGFLGLLYLLGQPLSPLSLAVALMLSAPSVTGSANFSILLGHDPAPALRLLILGTALLPLTCIPIFWLMPQFGALGAVLEAAGRLLAVILAAAVLGFALRHWGFRSLGDRGRRATDGLTVIALAVIVVGLMSAVRPTFDRDPALLAFWMAAAFAANFGMQIATFLVLRARGRRAAVPTSIVAGNRNFALFFVALPPESTDALLVFLGCYQVPMYLTPTLLRRLYDTA
ncbi:hypothetical protein SAMN05444007_1084 [Cribrihabitans marinus]|uniref:Bile acid:Na+ symporter, BASS family n=1 Tax=Cribrihabitans marinus TaxID=1227549 RepID=A0A1H7CA84_9RHOB|nr:hypothetical protein [Cribrihabitans marinus]GGH34837.1 hypothetical protein GCM10010973_27750 [Cribrihabitans marinus]SEJ86194.1 hypothetical protein SAMN05444007_1084 [Cribrihabitans marinus]